MNTLQDITGYSDDELSMIVFNDESLYVMRHHLDALLDTLNQCIKYTPDQLAVLQKDIAEDASELSN